MESLTIGQVARRAGIGVETVRFYEREGLIEEPSRRQSGYRQFSADVIPRLRIIRRARELGFSLKQIKELLDLRTDPSIACTEVRQRAETKVAEIEQRIEDLARMKRALQALAAECRENRTPSRCPFLEALSGMDELGLG